LKYEVEISKRSRFFIPPALLVALVTIFALLPFITKAFNIDDILFLWTAKHIQTNPLDFYGFQVNWGRYDVDMSAFNKNPPLVSYYIALITYFFGWKEIVLHLFFLIPAVCLSVGTYFLARSFCPSPHLPAILVVFSPVFLVSSATVMSDTMMVAFYVWAIYLWLEGLKKENRLLLLGSSLLIACSALTKYFGVTLIPLLLLYTLVEKRRVDSSLIFLFIPVVIISCYEWLSYSLYDEGLIASAVSYASSRGVLKSSNFIEKTLLGLSFTGGCLAGVAFFAPLLWSRQKFIPWAFYLFLLSIAVLCAMKRLSNLEIYNETGVPYGLLIQLALFISAGIHILILAIADLWENRNSSSLLLFLWVTGTFLFTCYINWTISARNIFPMLPAVAILVFSRIDHSKKGSKKLLTYFPQVPLVLAAIITFAVTWADFSLANAQRSAAKTFQARYSDNANRVFFQGHWGFQYYMESHGFKPLNFRKYPKKQGDIIIVPGNNTNLRRPDKRLFKFIGKDLQETPDWVSVMYLRGAGFYSSVWGPMPFVFANIPPEEYKVFLFSNEQKDSEKTHPHQNRTTIKFGPYYVNAAIKFGSSNAISHNHLGVALIRKGEVKEAIIQFRKAVSLNPKFAQYHSNLGMALSERKDFEEAAVHYREAIKLKPDYAAARKNLGIVLSLIN